MAPHSSTFDWKIPWMEEPGGLQSMGSLESDTTEWLHFHFSLSCIGEGNGNPLQCSCLENPRGGGAWWAAIYGVAQGRTWLKRLSSSSSCSYRLTDISQPVFLFSSFSWACSRIFPLADELFFVLTSGPLGSRGLKRPLRLHLRQMCRTYQNSLKLCAVSR